jgi:hypothetical protein
VAHVGEEAGLRLAGLDRRLLGDAALLGLLLGPVEGDLQREGALFHPGVEVERELAQLGLGVGAGQGGDGEPEGEGGDQDGQRGRGKGRRGRGPSDGDAAQAVKATTTTSSLRRATTMGAMTTQGSRPSTSSVDRPCTDAT